MGPKKKQNQNPHIRPDFDEQTDPSWWVEELWVKAFDNSTEKKEK